MASQGPNNPGTIVDNASVGSVAWSNPGNAAASDDSRASLSLQGPSEISHYLWCTNFGFTIPTEAIIEGVIVDIEKDRSTDEGPSFESIKDNSIRLIIEASLSGSNQGTNTKWPESDAYVSHGGVSNLWGTGGITPAQINDLLSGVAISAKNVGGVLVTASIDHVRMTVYYSTADEAAGIFVQASEPLFMRPQRAEGY